MSIQAVSKTNDSESPAREISERIVQLITTKQSRGLSEAVTMLNSYYPGKPSLVAKAYEVACLVALKRQEKVLPATLIEKLNPKADWLALSASQAISTGDLKEAFKLLENANQTGVRPSLCRQVVNQLLQSLANHDRSTVINYSAISVTTIEIGNVAGAGILAIETISYRNKRPYSRGRDMGSVDVIRFKSERGGGR